MSLTNIERDFQHKVSSKIRLVSEGLDRYRVLTPFILQDGDHLSVVLKKELEDWVLSDEAHTYMHLSYDIDMDDLRQGTRQEIITNTLSASQIEDRDGELLLDISEGNYGDALYSFVQALLHITDVSYLSRERVRSTFSDDFARLITEAVPEQRRNFEWNDPDLDPQGMYAVDCRINGMERPLLVHALPNSNRTRDATITLLQFEKWGVPFRSLAIFENQEEINRKVLARFSDICEKQFSSLGPNRERITQFITQIMLEQV